jgi:hypothetical protein
MGSEDDTVEICESLGAEVRRAGSGDRSAIRNGLSSDGLNMYLEPWEFISKGLEAIRDLDAPAHFMVVSGGMVSKEVRHWTGARFVNPIYETLDCESDLFADVVVSSAGAPDSRRENLARCQEWVQRRPTEPDPYYYAAFAHLALNEHDEFMRFASKYLLMKPGMDAGSTQIRYHIARIGCLRGADADSASHAAACVATHPTFAEFWCLMGDMFYTRRNYWKAKAFYENAMIMGRRRARKDPHPIEVAKYGKYPAMMIERISLMEKSSFRKE